MLAVLHVVVWIVNTLGHQPSPLLMPLPRSCTRSPFVPVSAVDAARTLLRNHSSISRLPQSTRSCKSSSGPRSCRHGPPQQHLWLFGLPPSQFLLSLLMARCIASVFWGRYLLWGLSHPLLSGGRSLSPGCSSPARARVPARSPVCRNECIFPNTWADKNCMYFGLVFPSCFSACVSPRAECDFVYALPRFPIPVGPGTVPP